MLLGLVLGGCEDKAKLLPSNDPDAAFLAPSQPSAKPLASAPRVEAPDAGATCGASPLPECPLHAWMKTNAKAAMTKEDAVALIEAFDKMATFAPPGYSNWASIAKDGSHAAKNGQMDAARAACRECHDQYKKKYRSEMRARPIP